MFNINHCQRAALLALGLVLLLALPGRGADDPKKIRIQDLDKLTGSEKVKEGEVTSPPYGFIAIRKALLEDPPGTKKLVQEALAMSKAKKPFSYNPALFLPLATRATTNPTP